MYVITDINNAECDIYDTIICLNSSNPWKVTILRTELLEVSGCLIGLRPLRG